MMSRGVYSANWNPVMMKTTFRLPAATMRESKGSGIFPSHASSPSNCGSNPACPIATTREGSEIFPCPVRMSLRTSAVLGPQAIS